jgi:hypothetical protein
MGCSPSDKIRNDLCLIAGANKPKTVQVQKPSEIRKLSTHPPTQFPFCLDTEVVSRIEIPARPHWCKYIGYKGTRKFVWWYFLWSEMRRIFTQNNQRSDDCTDITEQMMRFQWLLHDLLQFLRCARKAWWTEWGTFFFLQSRPFVDLRRFGCNPSHVPERRKATTLGQQGKYAY